MKMAEALCHPTCRYSASHTRDSNNDSYTLSEKRSESRAVRWILPHYFGIGEIVLFAKLISRISVSYAI